MQKKMMASGEHEPPSETREVISASRALAHDRLAHLYEISKVLADFQGIEETIPSALAIADEVVPLRSAVLIAEIGEAPVTLVWPAADPNAERTRGLVTRARACHAYFGGSAREVGSEGIDPSDTSRIIALPLVVDHQRVFGVLQLEPGTLDEPSLFFLSTMTNQLAAAIDRHRGWQREREQLREAEEARAFAQDLERRHRAVADALRVSEERWRMAAESAGVGTWDYDPATRVSNCDPTCCALTGLPPHARIELDVLVTAVHAEDRPRMLAAMARALDPAGSGEYEVDYRITGVTDRVERWVSARGRAQFEAGRPVRVLGTVWDITARRRAEEALRLSEARFAGIVSLAADAIISIDDAQRITLFNEAAERIFGYRAEEVLGEPLSTLLPSAARAAHHAHVEQFAHAPVQARLLGGRTEFRGRRKSGEEFPVEPSIAKLTLGGRTIFTAVLRDITEQRRIEGGWRLLAEAGAILAGSLEYEQTLGRVAELSVASFADCCMIDLVDEEGQLRRIAVAHADPAQGALARDLLRVALNRRRASPLARATETQRSELLAEVPPDFAESIAYDDEHLALLRALGPRSVIEVPLAARGRSLGAMVFVRSTTPRRYDPMDLRTAEGLARHAAFAVDNAQLYRAAQRAVRDRSEILGVVAHDLRDPLHAITMAATLLSRAAPPDEQDPARGKLGRIVRSSEQMSRLIEDLLDVTRIEAGRLSVSPRPHAAAALVTDAAEAARATLAEASLELDTDCADGLPPVLADADRVMQVFSNLIGNAAKFTPPGGRVVLGAARDGDGVRFWVSDTGAGMAESTLDHVFDRFWQARGSDRRGAGLGLAICKGIVDAHGGRIWAESAPGRGSTFSFRLPLAA